MKFSIEDFFSKYNHLCSFLRILSHLLKESLIENFIFCALNHFYCLYDYTVITLFYICIAIIIVAKIGFFKTFSKASYFWLLLLFYLILPEILT